MPKKPYVRLVIFVALYIYFCEIIYNIYDSDIKYDKILTTIYTTQCMPQMDIGLFSSIIELKQS